MLPNMPAVFAVPTPMGFTSSAGMPLNPAIPYTPGGPPPAPASAPASGGAAWGAPGSPGAKAGAPAGAPAPGGNAMPAVGSGAPNADLPMVDRWRVLSRGLDGLCLPMAGMLGLRGFTLRFFIRRPS